MFVDGNPFKEAIMDKLRLMSAAAGLILAVAPFTTASAADPGSPQTEMRGFPRGAQHIIGQSVTGSNGQKVGEVRDVVIGSSGEVEGIVLERGGIAGVGAKRVAVDWDQFSVDPQGGLRVNLDENQVSQLPSYEESSRSLIETPPPAQQQERQR
jgi:sporulation protein YlmC with PRC-barrel domain